MNRTVVSVNDPAARGFALLVERHPDRVRMGTWHQGHIHWRTTDRLRWGGFAEVEYELGVGWVSLTDKGLAAVEDFLDAQVIRERFANDTGERMTLEELVKAQGYDLEEFGPRPLTASEVGSLLDNKEGRHGGRHV